MNFSKFALLAPLILLCLMVSSCEPAISFGPSAEPASSGTATLEVLDNSSERSNGCQETPGVNIPAGSTLICSVQPGTTITFRFVGPLGTGVVGVMHQIVPVGNTVIPPSSVYNPNDNIPVSTYVIQGTYLTTPGSYNYQDIFNPQINGTIVVL